jgi:hypothetical protein
VPPTNTPTDTPTDTPVIPGFQEGASDGSPEGLADNRVAFAQVQCTPTPDCNVPSAGTGILAFAQGEPVCPTPDEDDDGDDDGANPTATVVSRLPGTGTSGGDGLLKLSVTIALSAGFVLLVLGLISMRRSTRSRP